MKRTFALRRSGITLAAIGCLSMISAAGCATSRAGTRSSMPDTIVSASASPSSSEMMPPSSPSKAASSADQESAPKNASSSDATRADVHNAPCERGTCSPVYTGPVDEYVSILDSGIPRFPQYPPLALREGVEGMVRVRVLVGTDGSLCDAEVVDGPELLWEPAIQAAREANMAPAMKDGCPVPIWVVIPFQFTLPPDARAKTARKSAR